MKGYTKALKDFIGATNRWIQSIPWYITLAAGAGIMALLTLFGYIVL